MKPLPLYILRRVFFLVKSTIFPPKNSIFLYRVDSQSNSGGIQTKHSIQLAILCIFHSSFRSIKIEIGDATITIQMKKKRKRKKENRIEHNKTTKSMCIVLYCSMATTHADVDCSGVGVPNVDAVENNTWSSHDQALLFKIAHNVNICTLRRECTVCNTSSWTVHNNHSFHL